MLTKKEPNKQVSKMIYCMVKIDKSHNVKFADDYFYNFVGDIGELSFDALLREDRIEEFNEAVCMAFNGEEVRLITYISGKTKEYQLVDIEMNKVDDEKIVLNINNIDSIEAGYLNISNVLKKYRAIMAMDNLYMFDYDFEKDVFTCLRYVNLKPIIMYKGNIKDFYDKYVEIGENKLENSAFNNWYKSVISGDVHFVYNIEGPNSEDVNSMITYRMEGTTIYKHNRQKLVVGIMKPVLLENENVIPYYATSEGKDPFTGLLNKRACEEYVRDTIESVKEVHYMAVIDIDNFKSVNDNYGHLYGDKVIKTVSEIISSVVAGRGIVGRFGGDEFFVFTNGMTNKTQLLSLLGCLKQSLREKFENEKCGIITLSIGVSVYPDSGSDYKKLFSIADEALYIAKRNGKDRYVYFNDIENRN